MWSIEQDNYLISMYATTDINVMVDVLGRTKASIMSRANSKFGIKKQVRKELPNTWSLQQEQYLRDNYKSMTITSMAKVVGYSPSGVRLKLIKMGLQRKDKDSASVVTKVRDRVSNKHYTQCLTAEQAGRMGVFLTMLTDVKRKNIAKKPNIILSEMVEAYRLAVG